MKAVLWLGIIVLVAGIVLFFLSGSTSGVNLQPTVPAIYGTNQLLWLGLGVLGLVMLIIGAMGRKK